MIGSLILIKGEGYWKSISSRQCHSSHIHHTTLYRVWHHEDGRCLLTTILSHKDHRSKCTCVVGGNQLWSCLFGHEILSTSKGCVGWRNKSVIFLTMFTQFSISCNWGWCCCCDLLDFLLVSLLLLRFGLLLNLENFPIRYGVVLIWGGLHLQGSSTCPWRYHIFSWMSPFVSGWSSSTQQSGVGFWFLESTRTDFHNVLLLNNYRFDLDFLQRSWGCVRYCVCDSVLPVCRHVHTTVTRCDRRPFWRLMYQPLDNSSPSSSPWSGLDDGVCVCDWWRV